MRNLVQITVCKISKQGVHCNTYSQLQVSNHELQSMSCSSDPCYIACISLSLIGRLVLWGPRQEYDIAVFSALEVLLEPLHDL